MIFLFVANKVQKYKKNKNNGECIDFRERGQKSH